MLLKKYQRMEWVSLSHFLVLFINLKREDVFNDLHWNGG